MLGADVVVAELQRLAERQLEDLLGARREGDVARRRRAALADDLLDLAAHGLERDAERLEGLGRDAFALVDQPEQDVLGADVVVVEEARFFLRQDDDPAGPVGEPFEQGEPPAPIWGIRGSSVSLAPGIPPPGRARPCGPIGRRGRQREPSGPFLASRRPSPTVAPVAAASPLLQLPGMSGFRARVDRALAGRHRGRGRAPDRDRQPPDQRRRQAGPAPVRGRLGRRPGARRGAVAEAVTHDVVLGGVSVELVHLGLALPRRRHGRGRDPPRRSRA